MLAVPEAKHLDVSDPDGAAGRRDIARRAMEDAIVRAGENVLVVRAFDPTDPGLPTGKLSTLPMVLLGLPIRLPIKLISQPVARPGVMRSDLR